MKKCVGCMYAQQRLKDGDRYTQKDAVFECTIRRGDNPDHRLVGCMDMDNGTIIERKLGCQWIRGQPPYQYVMQCVKDANRPGVFKKAVHCFYRMGNGGFEVKPGCFRTDGQSLIMACQMDHNGAMKLETYSLSQLKNVYMKGLRFC
uniref:Abnormal cell migration protein 18-like fibronectin type I domain-containing protein n=1 Tax=Romanomermis culicivorax TaxID=13658 RepID=A0A915HSF4_ROMCU